MTHLLLYQILLELCVKLVCRRSGALEDEEDGPDRDEVERAVYGVLRCVIDGVTHEVISIICRFSWPSTPGSPDWLRISRATEKALVVLLHAAVYDGQEVAAMLGVQAAREQLLSWEDSAEISR